MKKAYVKPEIVELPGPPREAAAMNSRITVCGQAPERTAWFEGISGALNVSIGRGWDLVELPVAKELMTSSRAMSGFAHTFWGAGANFNGNRVQHSCPMVLWVHPGIPVLHWLARIETSAGESQPSGTLRLVSNPEQPGAMQGGLTALANSAHVDLSALGLPDRFGGWTVGGHMGVLVQGEGLLGVRLQGVCQNVRVLWSAISQAHQE